MRLKFGALPCHPRKPRLITSHTSHIIRFGHSFSRPSDDHVGVALEADCVLRTLHVAGDLDDGIEQVNRHGGVRPRTAPARRSRPTG